MALSTALVSLFLLWKLSVVSVDACPMSTLTDLCRGRCPDTSDRIWYGAFDQSALYEWLDLPVATFVDATSRNVAISREDLPSRWSRNLRGIPSRF